MIAMRLFILSMSDEHSHKCETRSIGFLERKALLFVLIIYLIAAWGCKERDFNSPFDPQGEYYIGQGLSADSNNNGKADGLEPLMVTVTGGCFIMGSYISQESDEAPAFNVCVSDFLIKATEVTQGEYRAVFPSRNFDASDDYKPISNVSWYMAVSYCNQLSVLHNLEAVYTINGNIVEIDYLKKGYRLPTEAEWEYAYSADSGNAYYWGNNPDSAGLYAWYITNSGNSAHDVAGKLANSIGIYDMAGNVWEWVNDWHGPYPQLPNNPQGPVSGDYKVAKGSCWRYSSPALRGSNRLKIKPEDKNEYTGFRIVRSL